MLSEGALLTAGSLVCRFALHIPENLEMASSAPLLCAGITTYSPLMHYGLNKPGTKFGVVGLGGLGHMAVKIAKAMGCEVSTPAVADVMGLPKTGNAAWCQHDAVHPSGSLSSLAFTDTVNICEPVMCADSFTRQLAQSGVLYSSQQGTPKWRLCLFGHRTWLHLCSMQSSTIQQLLSNAPAGLLSGGHSLGITTLLHLELSGRLLAERVRSYCR